MVFYSTVALILRKKVAWYLLAMSSKSDTIKTLSFLLYSMDLIKYNTILYYTILYNTIQYNTIQYYTIQYNTILYYTIQYDTRDFG